MKKTNGYMYHRCALRWIYKIPHLGNQNEHVCSLAQCLALQFCISQQLIFAQQLGFMAENDFV